MATRFSLAATALLLPVAAAAQSGSDGLHTFLQSAFADSRAETPDLTYTAAFADLDGDGRSEALVVPNASAFCGSGGCGLYIFTPDGSSWRQVDEQTIVGTSLWLLPTRTRGWRDLAVNIRGGGFDVPRRVRLRFDGRGYAVARLRGAPGRMIINETTPSRPLFR